MNQAVLELRELAALLRVSPRTVSRRLETGTFPIRPLGISRKLLFLRADVERLLAGEADGRGRRRAR